MTFSVQPATQHEHCTSTVSYFSQNFTSSANFTSQLDDHLNTFSLHHKAYLSDLRTSFAPVSTLCDLCL